MAQLIVRNLEDDIVRELKSRAAQHGRSAEAEHREILRRTLLTSRDLLLATPAVGESDHLEQERAVRAAAGIWSSNGRDDPDEEIRKLRGAWRNRTERLEQDGG